MAVEIVFCYAHEDEKFLNELLKQLSPWQGVIATWSDQNIPGGQDRQQVMQAHMDSAQVIMLLVSPDFIHSNSYEMQYAIDLCGYKNTCVIPVILRPIDWQATPIGKLQALPPPNGEKPVVEWRNRDRALYEVAMGLRTVLFPLLSSEDQAAFEVLPKPAKDYISRRTVVALLAVVASVIGSGIALIKRSQGSLINTSTPTVQISEQSPQSPASTAQPTVSDTPDFATQTSTPSPVKTIYTYRGHKNVVSSVSWAPAGTHVVSGSYDKTAQVWEATEGTPLLRIYTGHTDKVNAVMWSPKGTYVASAGSDKTVQVWNPATGVMVYKYTGHSDVVTALAWSPDGTKIASASYDGTVQIWRATTGQHVLTYPLNSPSPNWICAVAWSPDGVTIASGDSSGRVDIWSTADPSSEALPAPMVCPRWHGHLMPGSLLLAVSLCQWMWIMREEGLFTAIWAGSLLYPHFPWHGHQMGS
jgi:hypothetical protein